MSVSTAPGGSPYVADPKNVELNASRLSHMSTSSTGSAITLGGVDYHVGSRVGKTGAFVIGDPDAFDPHKTFGSLNSSQTGGSGKGLVHATPIEEKGYDFEEWNWPVIRLSCLVMVCAVMIGLLATVIGICVEHRIMCSSPFDWYKGSTMYHIQVPYFSDLDGDKFGDIQGMTDELDYVEFLGTEVVVLSQLLPSEQPSWDSYTSFTGVDSRLGLITDFDTFTQKAHDESQLKVILDFSPVFTSDNHDWFKDSIQDSDSYSSPYADFYIWRQQPDQSIGGAWTKSINRDMYYLNMNDSAKPILNWGSQKLQDKFLSVLDFWLERRMDGFMIRNMDQVFGTDLQGLSNIIKEWRQKCDEYNKLFSRKVLAFESTFMNRIASAPANIRDSIDLVVVPVVMDKNDTYSLQAALDDGLKYSIKTDGPWICWEVQGLSGVDPHYVTSVQMYTIMLPGTPMLRAGQEIGNFKPQPMLWRSESLYPYHPGSPLNETTIKALKALITKRSDSYAIREDSLYQEKPHTVKDWNYDFKKINKDMIVLERKYRRKTAYYYMGNYHSKDLSEIDISFISAYGDVVTDTANRYKGQVNLQEVKLIQGQGLVFSIIQ